MYYSPKTSTDGLVFHYDTGNTVRSYLGEPTTNQFTNPDFSNGTTGWTFGSWDGGRYTYTTETVMGPFGRPVTALKVVRTTSDTSYAHFHQNNGGKFTNGNTYTLSAYVKGAGTLGQYNQGGYGPITYNPGQFVTLTGEWRRISYTLTSQTDSLYPYWAAEGITQNVPMYFTLAQSEQKSHITPFVNGTRSATQGLKDLTNNSTLDLTNVSFDSNAQPTWDGTDDQIAVTGFTQPTDPNIYSVEAVVKLYAHNPGTNIGSVIVNNYSSLYGWIFYLNGPLSYLGIRHHDGASGGYDLVYGTGINLNQFYHIVATDDKTTVRLYLNGTQVASRASATALNYSGQPTIGQFGGNNAVTNGEIPVVKIYNKTLSADEVRNNYRHYKTRFDI